MTKTIQLTNGGEALVDARDYPLLSRFNWHRNHNDYAQTWVSGKNFLMHRMVFGSLPMGHRVIIDHKNRNRLDNRLCNLRKANRSLNVLNKPGNPNAVSKYKGVTWGGRRWRARVMVNSKTIDLGRFDCEEDAARAYDDAARELFGEFAYQNFNASGAGAGA